MLVYNRSMTESTLQLYQVQAPGCLPCATRWAFRKYWKALKSKRENIGITIELGSTKVLHTVKGDHRRAEITAGEYFTRGQYVVSFYYDGFPDFEWKKGSHGIACDICETLEQAKRKANYYVKKDQM